MRNGMIEISGGKIAMDIISLTINSGAISFSSLLSIFRRRPSR
jgi:hypothetical protein